MGWLTRLFGGATRARFDSSPRPLATVISEMMESIGHVGRREALSVPAVLRGRNMICSVSTLPLETVDADFRVLDNPLLRQIDPNTPNVVTLAQTLEDLLFEGVAWWRITNKGWDFYPTTAVRLDPGQVSMNPPTGYAQGYLPSGWAVTGGVYVDGKPVAWTEIIRFDSPNPPLLTAGSRAIRRALALDKAAEMYANDPRPMAYFTPTEGADPIDDDEVETFLGAWGRKRRKRSTAYVPAALTYNEVQQPTPADLQLVELQKQAALDIANALGVDPEDLGISTTSRTYQNATDRRKDRINDTLSPYMRAITDRLSMGDVTKRGQTVRFNLDDYLKADPKTRAEVQAAYLAMGVTDAAEIRTDERRAPRVVQPPIPATVGEPMPALEASEQPRVTLARETGLTFDGVTDVAFAVNEEARTITGLAVPYGQVARSNGRKWRFAKGSIRYSSVNRVKLLRDHDNSQAVGVATAFTETDAGLVATFRIARGEAGDRALALAADGVLDGLSIGVDFQDEHFKPDPLFPGASLVVQAALREVSLTAVPAFDDSRLTSVRASDQGRTAMPCATCGTVHAEGVVQCPTPTPPAVPAPVTFSAEQVQAILGGQLQVPAQPVQTPQVVVPTAPTAAMTAVQMDEAAPYRFDRTGNLTAGPKYDFSTDLINGGKGDAEALERAQQFMRTHFDVDRADAVALNPSAQRPDMYVDQREYRYPLWNVINKGSLRDSTPFVFPKFNTAAGLVAAHTEGVEPTPGSFTATTQTVTPAAKSGKVEITRETWDQGGNPQISGLIWRQMERAWYEALEASAVAVLDAATPTAIALTAGGGTTGQTLASEITAAFASLQFVRGGFRMTDMFTQVDLYKALIAAKDGSGRPLYPALGPTNAHGTVSQMFGAIDLNGVVARPAWALAATGSVVASSYLFDRGDVHGWATAPQRLTFEYRVAYIDLAIWGYAATAISDITGVREITYDPVP